MPPRRPRAQRARQRPKRFTPSTPSTRGMSAVGTSPWQVTPVVQPSPVLRVSQAREVQDLQARVAELEASLSQVKSPEPHRLETMPVRQANSEYQQHSKVIGSQALPLYTSLDQEHADQISRGEFVDLKIIARKSHPSFAALKADQMRLPITSWSRMYLRLMSQAIKSGNADPQDLIIHMDTVLALAEEKHQWEQYDSEFRKQSVNAGYTFGHTRVELYARAVTRPQPFRTQRPMVRRRDQQIPLGACFLYHSQDKRCNIPNCSFSHNCHRCGGKHPQYLCGQNRGYRQESETAEPKEKKAKK